MRNQSYDHTLVVLWSCLKRLFQTDFRTAFSAGLLLPTLTQGGISELKNDGGTERKGEKNKRKDRVERKNKQKRMKKGRRKGQETSTWSLILKWIGNAVCVVIVFLCGSNQRQNSLGNCPGSDLGQKLREGKKCPRRNGEVSTRQRESSPLAGGWRAVRGADCMSLGLEWRRRLVEIWTDYCSPFLCSPFSVRQCWDPDSLWLSHSFSSSSLFSFPPC